MKTRIDTSVMGDTEVMLSAPTLSHCHIYHEEKHREGLTMIVAAEQR
jgi:hypothetical protein